MNKEILSGIFLLPEHDHFTLSTAKTQPRLQLRHSIKGQA